MFYTEILIIEMWILEVFSKLTNSFLTNKISQPNKAVCDITYIINWIDDKPYKHIKLRSKKETKT